MSILEDKILSRIMPTEGEAERRITVLISASRVAHIKQIADTMSKISGQRVTQTMLFEDAVDAFIDECMANPELAKHLPAPEQSKDNYDCPSGGQLDEPLSNGPVISL